MRGIRNPELVVVTGAGSGIGRATALEFARRGARVIASDLNADTAEQTAVLVKAEGGTAFAYQLDVTDPAAWQEFATTVRIEHDVPDVLVNNAGIAVVGSFLDQSPEAWTKQLDVNLNGVVNGCRAFARPMIERGRRAHIVNISSVAAFLPTAMGPSYCLSKAGVRMFSECLRLELAEYGIGVSAVCPGGAATGIIGALDLEADLDVEKFTTDRIHAIAGQWVERYGPSLGFSPHYIARGVVRAVRYNWGVLPVRPESWAGYALHRLSPGLVRLISGQVTSPERIRALAGAAGRMVPERVVESVQRATETAESDRPVDLVRSVIRELRTPASS